MATNTKIYVLDTNVLLHDSRSLFSFQDNDIVLPITILEELDKFKKGHDEINYHAREINRELDKLAAKSLFNEGVPLGEGMGRLFVETGKPFSDKLQLSFSESIADNRIIAIAEYVTEKNPDRKVVMVSKDINMRLKAKSLGIHAEDYETDRVVNVDPLKISMETKYYVDDAIINKLYAKKGGGKVGADTCGLDRKFAPNEYAILQGTKSDVIVYFNAEDQTFERVDKRRCYGIEPRNAEQAIAMHALMRPGVELIGIMGKAGTGKTLLALAAALEQAMDYNQILLARPIVAMSDKDLGFLPGNEKDKIKPYMQPLFDNLSVIKQALGNTGEKVQMIEQMLKQEHLIISPLAYIRGRSLNNVFFIIDEAQNLTPHEVKTIITRAGEGTKIVFTGDIHQIDSPYLDAHSNGLTHMIDRMRGQSMFSHINLVQGERSHLAEVASNLL